MIDVGDILRLTSTIPLYKKLSHAKRWAKPGSLCVVIGIACELSEAEVEVALIEDESYIGEVFLWEFTCCRDSTLELLAEVAE